jgi:hypothetical protein
VVDVRGGDRGEVVAVPDELAERWRSHDAVAARKLGIWRDGRNVPSDELVVAVGERCGAGASSVSSTYAR